MSITEILVVFLYVGLGIYLIGYIGFVWLVCQKSNHVLWTKVKDGIVFGLIWPIYFILPIWLEHEKRKN